MHHKTRLHLAELALLGFCIVLIVGGGLAVASSVANAQETGTDAGDDQSAPTTPDSDGNATGDDSGGSDGADAQSTDAQPYEYVFAGDNLRIVESRWDGKTLIAEFEAVNRPERITVTDAGRTADDNENIEIDRESYTISTEGTTEIHFAVVEDRQVTIDDGTTLILKGYSSGALSVPEIDELIALALGLIAPVVGVVGLKLRGDRLHRNSPRRLF